MKPSKQNLLIWLVEHCSQNAYVLAIQIVGNIEDAKDVLQQSYAKVIQQNSLPTDTNDLLPWFKRIVRNTAIDKVRAKSKWYKKDRQLKYHHELMHHEESLSTNIEKSERKKIIDLCLRKLSSEHRELIVLRDYHDYSYQDIAKILDIAKGTVMSRLHRARLALRKEFNKLSQEGDL